MSDEEKKAIGEIDISKTIESNINYWRNEYFKQQKELEQEKEKNKELEEMLKHRIKYTNELEKDLFENASNYVIPKSKVAEILKQRLNKYQDADDGEYKQEYLTRGELELVDRYKECSELLKILCEEDIYKIELDYIPKSKLRVLNDKFKILGYYSKEE